MSWPYWLMELACTFILYVIAISFWDGWQEKHWARRLNYDVKPKRKFIFEFAPWIYWRAWKAATVEQIIQKQGEDAKPLRQMDERIERRVW